MDVSSDAFFLARLRVDRLSGHGSFNRMWRDFLKAEVAQWNAVCLPELAKAQDDVNDVREAMALASLVHPHGTVAIYRQMYSPVAGQDIASGTSVVVVGCLRVDDRVDLYTLETLGGEEFHARPEEVEVPLPEPAIELED